MDEMMMVMAEQDQVVQIGRAMITNPLADVMSLGVAPLRRTVRD
jgi:hypothetical protein